MIIEATEVHVVQRAADGTTRTIPLTDLLAGVSVPSAEGESVHADPNIIAMPPWPDGAQEFLNRTFDGDHASGSASIRTWHRRLVNAVHARLVADGRVDPGCVDLIDGSASAPTVALPFAIDPALLPPPAVVEETA